MSETTERTGFVRKSFFRLSWPLLLVIFVTLASTLGNTIIITRHDESLNAATSIPNQIFGVLYDVSVLFSIGALVVIAQYLGASKFGAARRASKVALWASSILGVVIALAVLLLGKQALQLLGTDANLLDKAWTYMWIAGISLAFNAFIGAASAVLRAYGRTPALLMLAIIVAVVDLAMVYVFVEMLNTGAAGAALPSLIVRGVGALVLALMVWRAIRATRADEARELAAAAEPVVERSNGALAGLMAKLSWPTVLEMTAFNVVVVTTLIWLNPFGEAALNGRIWALNLTALVTGIVLALAQSNETIVGWDAGAHEARAARRLTLKVVVGAAIASAALGFVLWHFGDVLLGFIGGTDPVALADAKTALLYSIALLPLSAITAVLYGALRSAGDVVWPMMFSIFASVAVLLPLSWFLIEKQQLSVGGVFLALIAMEAVRATLLLVRFLSGTWAHTPTVVDELPVDEAAVRA